MFKRLAGRLGTMFGAAGLSCIASLALACTGITLTGQDGSVVRARTLEWGDFDLRALLNIMPRNTPMSAAEPTAEVHVDGVGVFHVEDLLPKPFELESEK